MPLKIGLLGFGTVGSSFAEVLAASGADAAITHVFNRNVARKKDHPRATFVPASARFIGKSLDSSALFCPKTGLPPASKNATTSSSLIGRAGMRSAIVTRLI